MDRIVIRANGPIRVGPDALEEVINEVVVLLWFEVLSLARSTSKLVIVSSKINGKEYCKTLDAGLIPQIDVKFNEEGDWYVFQQDGGPAHTEKYSQDYLANKWIQTMWWSAKSPD